MITVILCIVAIIWAAFEVNEEERKAKINHREKNRYYTGFYNFPIEPEKPPKPEEDSASAE